MVWQKNVGLPISAGCIICVVIFGSGPIRDAAADYVCIALTRR
jgi:hypothetical protein